MEWNAQIQSGNVKVHVNFTGGYENKWGVAPAVYSTDNPITQRLIENSFEFKSGRIQLIGNYEVESKEKKADKKKAEPAVLPLDQQADFFNKNIELTVAKIVDVKPNPEGEKLYIETLDDGSGTPRTIQSGLRMYLKESDLLGKHVIIASNLAPRTMRGVESRGMLLAGDYKDADGKDCVEVLDASWAAPGTKVVLEGADANATKKEQITGDEFFAVQIAAKDGLVQIAGKKLLADGKEIKTEKALNSEIG